MIPQDILEQDRICREMISQEGMTPWMVALRDLEKCTHPLHTVMRMPVSSSWVFMTGPHTNWAVDPVPPYGATDEQVEKLAEGLAKFDFCLISHLDADHYRPALLRAASRKGAIHWFIPQCIQERFVAEVQPAPEQLTVMPFGFDCQWREIRIFCLPGYHADPTRPGVASAAFAVHLPDGVRLAFPGDVRDFSASIPMPMMKPDYLFAHLWLGRECSHLQAFPKLPEFCGFLKRFTPKRVILGHLLETSRDIKSIWTYRHARIVRKHMMENPPAIPVEIPLHDEPMCLYPEWISDHYAGWTRQKQCEFASWLGFSIKNDYLQYLELAIRERIPVLEVNANIFSLEKDELGKILESLAKWRENGGRLLSLHLGGFLPEMPEDASWEQVRILGADRVTKHVPAISVAEYRKRHSEVIESYVRQMRPILKHNVVIGIENMHMKQDTPHDERRGYGFQIPEWISFVKELREICQAPRVGCHLDLGHAYANFPFSMKNTLDEWLTAGSGLLNGVHIHQFLKKRTQDAPYPQGHAHVSGRMAGFPSLEPLFRFWQNSECHFPLILEIRKGETDPMPSIRRMLATLPF